MDRRRARLVYLGVSVALLALYAVVAPLMWSNRTWDDSGPLALTAPKAPLPAGWSVEKVKDLCTGVDDEYDPPDVVKGGTVRGQLLFGCYDIEDGGVFSAWVVNEFGVDVNDPGLLKDAGAWRWIGGVKSAEEVWLGGWGMAALLAFLYLYYRVSRPGPPNEAQGPQRSWVLITLAAIPVFGWAILAGLRDVPRERRIRALFQGSMALGVAFGLVALTVPKDGLTWFVYSMFGAAAGFGIGFGRWVLAPEGFGEPQDRWEQRMRRAAREERTRPPRPDPKPRPPKRAVEPPAPAPVPSSAVEPADDNAIWEVERPEALPNFSDVGGMDELKAELRETIGLSLAFAGEAESYKLTWNGILLHGRPGTGKTFVARATAGEFGLNFIHVSSGDLVSAFRGESGRNVDEVFEFAARNVPCLLFFDEFDSIAQNREDWPDQEARRTVNQLLQSIVEYRVVREQIVMAATNHVEQLDPAVVRPGRFDRLVRVDLPDEEGRAAVFKATLRGRPTATDIDVEDLARRSAGMTPAAIAHTVEVAAIAALRRTAKTGGAIQRITQGDLIEALGARGGEDRPSVEGWTWDDLVLPPDVVDELQQLQYLVEDPELARGLGVEPPSGVLLTGPPGTGKTSIAKVLAAQANCSFYPVSAGDLTSMWLGESEKSIQRLFDRARDNRPSIVFIDEIDAIASKRGEWGSYDRQINELLVQMDGMSGQQGVLVLAATNRPDQLDPALLRGGRLSRTIEIPLPDLDGRVRLLELFSRKMPLSGVDLRDVAAAAEGASGADLRALCQQAGLAALVRVRKKKGGGDAVTQADFDEALSDWAETRQANEG